MIVECKNGGELILRFHKDVKIYGQSAVGTKLVPLRADELEYFSKLIDGKVYVTASISGYGVNNLLMHGGT